ncbi:MAG TPA: fused MFS/spermidine synthase [Bacteroidales bacterium]|nr:fused MFS/spermidine synthase [Bacteroidales bacterium]
MVKKKDLLLSYIWPQVIEESSSRWNPVLEVTLSAGKYHLNSANTNYSYGSLYLMFKRLFRHLKPDWDKIDNVLLLGFGAGSVALLINKYKKECLIDGVEIDEKVIELGRKYFQTDKLKNVTVYCDSATRYIENCRKRYDLVIIDVYLDLVVPGEVETEEFLFQVRDALNPGGMVIFNKFINSRESREKLPVMEERYRRIFGSLRVVTMMTTGKIFVAEKQ